MTASPKLDLASIRIMPARARLVLSWEPGDSIMVTDALAKAAIERYPTIVAHSCINPHGPSFGHAIRKTSIPHLIEHIIIEEQVGAMLARGGGDAKSLERTLVGTTTLDESKGEAVVEVSFADDLVCARAAVAAVEFANSHA